MRLPGFTFDFAKGRWPGGAALPFLTGSPSLNRVTARRRAAVSAIAAAEPAGAAPVAEHRPPRAQRRGAAIGRRRDVVAARSVARVHTIADLAASHSPDRARLPAAARRLRQRRTGCSPISMREPRPAALGRARPRGRSAPTSSTSSPAGASEEVHSTKAATGCCSCSTEAGTGQPRRALDARRHRAGRRSRVDAPRQQRRVRRHRHDPQPLSPGARAARPHLGPGAQRPTFHDGVSSRHLESILLTTPAGYRAGDARSDRRDLLAARQGGERQARLEGAERRSRRSLCRRVGRNRGGDAGRRGAGARRGADQPDSRCEQGRWVSFSFDRLWQFGYRFDTF